MKYFRLALSFLTIFPVKISEPIHPGDFGRSGVWFPLIGSILGANLWLFGEVTNWMLPILPASVVLAGVWVFFSGGLHLDGLADCCDGLLNASTKERRLEIMKDPRLGTFGVAGLILHLLLKTTLIYGLIQSRGFLPFILAPTLGRWFILIAARQSLARPGGMGADFAAGINSRIIFISGILPIILIVGFGGPGIASAGLAGIVLWGVLKLTKSKIGGVTGDVFGLVVELSESSVLLGWTVYMTFLSRIS